MIATQDNTKSHKELFPEQYSHPLCGKAVAVETINEYATKGIVERVVNSKYGELAVLKDRPAMAFRVEDCTEVVA